MLDQYGRNIHYLRLSITDKCNLRCRYCMPDGIEKCGHEDMLSYEEMERLVHIFSSLGIDTVRITGGEPLVKRDVATLITKIRKIPGITHVSMTTNGVLLKEKITALTQAGLDSVNVSLDSLQRERFQSITGFDCLEQVLQGIDAALLQGIPVKINCVPQKGINEDELLQIAELAKNEKLEVRFIELMPIGQGASSEGICNDELKKNISQKYGKLNQESTKNGFGPAVVYSIDGFQGKIGFISAIHGKFCQSCNRVRLTAKGQLKCCLASDAGTDLRSLLKAGASDEEIKRAIELGISRKPLEHHFEDSNPNDLKGMFQIGG